MADIAQIGFGVDTSGLERANRQLDRLADQDVSVKRSNENIARSFDATASKSTQKIERMQRSINRDFQAIGNAAKQAGQSIDGLDTPFKVLKSSASDAARSVNSSLSRIAARADQTKNKLLEALGGGAGIRAIAGRAALGGTAAASGGALLGGAALSNVRDIQNLSDAINATTTQTQRLLVAFERFRLNSDDVSDAINTLTDRASDAESGMQSFIDDFSLVGIEVEDLRGKRPIELFRTFADAIEDTENANKRQTAAVRIFGDEVGNRLLPLLQQGSDAFDEIGDQAEKNGRILSTQQVRAANDASVALSDLFGTIQDQGTKAFANFAPTVEEAADSIRGLTNEISNGDLIGQIGGVADVLGNATLPGQLFTEFLDDLNRAGGEFSRGEILNGFEGLARALPPVSIALGDVEQSLIGADAAVRKMNKSLLTAEGRSDVLSDALGVLNKTAQETNESFNESTLIVNKNAEATKNQKDQTENAITTFRGLNDTLRETSGFADDLAERDMAFLDQLNIGPVNEVTASIKKATDEIERLEDRPEQPINGYLSAMGESATLIDDARVEVAGLTDELTDFEKRVQDVSSDITKSFDDFFANVVRNGEFAFDRLGDSILNALSQDAGQQLTQYIFGEGGLQNIVGNLLGSGQGQTGIVDSISSVFESGDVIGSISEAFSDGLSGALSNVGPASVAAIGSQIGGAALSAISSGRLGRRDFFEASATAGATAGGAPLGGALGGGITGVSFAEGLFGGQVSQRGENLAAIGGGIGNLIAPGIGSVAGGILGSLFGGLSEVENQGLRLGVNQGRVTGRRFARVETTGILGSDDEVFTRDLFESQRQALNETFGDLKQRLSDMLDGIVDVNSAIQDFSLEKVELDLKGLDAAARQAKIDEFFTDVIEQFFSQGPSQALRNVAESQDFESLSQAFETLQFSADVLNGELFKTASASDRVNNEIKVLRSEFESAKDRAQDLGIRTDALKENFVDFRSEIVRTSDLTIKELMDLKQNVDTEIAGGELSGAIQDAINNAIGEGFKQGNIIVQEAIGNLSIGQEIQKAIGTDISDSLKDTLSGFSTAISDTTTSVETSKQALLDARSELSDQLVSGNISQERYIDSLQFLARQYEDSRKKTEALAKAEEQRARAQEKQQISLLDDFKARFLEVSGQSDRAQIFRAEQRAKQTRKRAQELGLGDTPLIEGVLESELSNLKERLDREFKGALNNVDLAVQKATGSVNDLTAAQATLPQTNKSVQKTLASLIGSMTENPDSLEKASERLKNQFEKGIISSDQLQSGISLLIREFENAKTAAEEAAAAERLRNNTLSETKFQVKELTGEELTAEEKIQRAVGGNVPKLNDLAAALERLDGAESDGLDADLKRFRNSLIETLGVIDSNENLDVFQDVFNIGIQKFKDLSKEIENTTDTVTESINRLAGFQNIGARLAQASGQQIGLGTRIRMQTGDVLSRDQQGQVREILRGVDETGASASKAVGSLKQFIEGLDISDEAAKDLSGTLNNLLVGRFERANQRADDANQEEQRLQREQEQNRRDFFNNQFALIEDREQKISQLQQKRNRILNEEIDRINEQIDRQREIKAAFNEASQSIREFRNELLTSEQSPLSPGEQFAAAQEQFNRTLSAARGGDLQAIDRLSGVSETFLDQAREQFGATTQFANVFERVQSGLGATEQTAKDQARKAQQQIDLQREQIANVRESNAQIVALNQQIADLKEQLADQRENVQQLQIESVSGDR